MSDRVFRLLLALFILPLSLGVVWADDDDDDDDDDDWRVARDRCLVEAQRLVMERARVNVDERALAQSLGLPYPVRKPEVVLSMVFLNARNKVPELVDKEFTREKAAKAEEEIRAAYTLFKVGEVVEVYVVKPDKQRKLVKGRFMGATSSVVHIGTKWISTKDLEEGTVVRFFPDDQKEYVEKALQEHAHAEKLRMKQFEDDTLAKILDVDLPSAGYLPIQPDKTKPGYYDADNWQSGYDYYKSELEKMLKEISKKRGDDRLIGEYMEGHDYILYKGEWLPEDEYKERTRPKKQPAPKKKGFFQKLRDLGRD